MTLTAPATATKLETYSVQRFSCSDTVNPYRGKLYAWDDATKKLVGAALYDSGARAAVVAGSTETFAVNAAVTPGATYAFILTMRDDVVPAATTGCTFSAEGNGYAGGGLIGTVGATTDAWDPFYLGTNDMGSTVWSETPTTTALTSTATSATVGTPITFTATVTSTGTPTTNVQLLDGTTQIGLQAVSGSPAKTDFVISNLTAGPHSISAKFLNASPLDPSTSNTIPVTITKNTPSFFVVAPAVLSSKTGETVNFTVVVSGGPPTATGNVTFSDNGTSFATVALSGGVVGVSHAFATAGNHSFKIDYEGDSGYSPGSKTVTQVVSKADSTVTLTSNHAPSFFGDNVTFTAQVNITAPGAGTPTGTVEFFDGTTSLGAPVAVDGTGKAELTINTLTVDTHSITGVYSGDAAVNGTTSNAVSQVVQKDGTIVNVASSKNPSFFGDTVTFTATVSASGSSGTPTGTVSFTDNGVSMGGPVTLDGSAVGAITTSTLAAGPHSIVATYNGDGNHAAGSTGTVAQTVNKAITATTLASSKNPSAFGESVTFTATVSSTAGTPTNAVVFTDNGTQVRIAAVTAGVATFTTSALTVGTHAIAVIYQGDGSFAASSANVSQVVGVALTTTAIVSSSNPIGIGSPVKFTVTVAPTTGTNHPAGDVTITSDATPIATVALDANGIATFETSTLTAGTHAIGATYAGNASFFTSTATPLSQIVSAAAATISLVGVPAPAVFGATVTISAHVTGANGTPSGTIAVHEGATALGTITLDGTGNGSLTNSTLDAGTHTITGDYAGDATYAAGIGTFVIVVQPAPTTTTLASSKNPAKPGESITLTATVSGGAGEVEFFDGAVSLGTATLASGTATFTVNDLTEGAHSYTAKYAGDANHATSTSSALTENVTNEEAVPDAGAGDDGGGSVTDAGTGSGSKADASTSTDGGTKPATDSDNSSCDCDLVGGSSPGASGLGLIASALIVLGARRRRRLVKGNLRS